MDNTCICCGEIIKKEADRIKQLERVAKKLQDELATCNWIIDKQCEEIAKLKHKKRGLFK